MKSPHMAEMLTFLRSQSTEYVLRTYNLLAFADENFAREVMQLFTVGLTMLNMDGSPIKDPVTGHEILTYENEHVMSYARAWTGFDRQFGRGNIELSGGNPNRIDPMQLHAEWRDVYPKIHLENGYIGDGYPLCVDLPDKEFLRKGAKYRLLGS